MIEKQLLRSLVMEVLVKKPKTQAIGIIDDTERLVKERGLFQKKKQMVPLFLYMIGRH